MELEEDNRRSRGGVYMDIGIFIHRSFMLVSRFDIRLKIGLIYQLFMYICDLEMNEYIQLELTLSIY